MNDIISTLREAFRFSGFRPPLVNMFEPIVSDGEIFPFEASPSMIQCDRRFLCRIERCPKFFPLLAEPFTSTRRS